MRNRRIYRVVYLAVLLAAAVCIFLMTSAEPDQEPEIKGCLAISEISENVYYVQEEVYSSTTLDRQLTHPETDIDGLELTKTEERDSVCRMPGSRSGSIQVYTFSAAGDELEKMKEQLKNYVFEFEAETVLKKNKHRIKTHLDIVMIDE